MANVKAIYERPLKGLDTLGHELSFYIRVILAVPRTISHYPREIVRLLAEVTLGSGALAVIGGTIGVILGMTFFTGAQVGLSGYAALNQLGTAAFAGFVSAYFNTREIAPLVAGIALAATVGCGFTAQLGAMRISEEVDALEVMAIPSLPFLVTTRIVAALSVTLPLFAVGLLASYGATQLLIQVVYHQSAGTYRFYFHAFLNPTDLLYAFVKVVVFSVVITMVHCYHGYNARGGPEGVGRAVGRAIRTSIVSVIIIDMLLSLLFWGTSTTVRISG
jgi:phospholipid/cholesterol/gamma-HCH transport system permease protein